MVWIYIIISLCVRNAIYLYRCIYYYESRCQILTLNSFSINLAVYCHIILLCAHVCVVCIIIIVQLLKYVFNICQLPAKNYRL